jgi:hypothetical protein
LNKNKGRGLINPREILIDTERNQDRDYEWNNDIPLSSIGDIDVVVNVEGLLRISHLNHHVLLCSSAAVFGLLGLTKKHSPGLSGLFSLSGLFGSQKELERPDRLEKLEKPNWLLEFVEFIGLLESIWSIVSIGFIEFLEFINLSFKPL